MKLIINYKRETYLRYLRHLQLAAKVYARVILSRIGATENAGVENAIPAKLQGWKMQE